MINRFFRGSSASRALRVSCLLMLATVVAGCESAQSKRDNMMLNPDNPFRASVDNTVSSGPQSEATLKLEAARAYGKAHASLLNTDYEAAITQYQLLIARYPFTEYATQAELEKVFAQYRSFKPDEALLAADRFLREHPRHKHADYVQYLKGLINSARTASISDYLPLDSSQKDVNAERRAYDDFAVLVQRYPQSVYAGDARKRMIFLRNRIASHELSIVRFYVKRQAWVAVAKRAENLIAEYPGAPATAEALSLLRVAYDKLDLKPQIADLERIVAANQEALRLAGMPEAEPGPRSRIGFPEEAAAAGAKLSSPALAGPAAGPAAETAAAPPAPTGFFGRLGHYLDKLNGSYTLDKDQVKDSAAPQPAGGEVRPESAPAATAGTTRPSTRNPDREPSLTTGPYFQDTVVDIAPLPGSSTAAAPAGAAAPAEATPPAAAAAAPASAPAPAAVPPAKKRGFFGWLESLSGSYTVGDDGKVVETPAASPSPSPAPAAAPSPAPTGTPAN